MGIAAGLATLTQIINKLLINEKMVDEGRAEISKLQKKLKGMDMKSKEFNKTQERMLDLNFKMMKQQFKPMFVTFIPYIIVFYFIGNMFSYTPFMVGSEVELIADGEGEMIVPCLNVSEQIDGYKEKVELAEKSCNATLNGKQVSLTLNGTKPVTEEANGIELTVNPPEKTFIHLPFSLPFIGDDIGWLGTFILTSLVTSLVLQKALKGRYLRKWD